MRLDQLTFDITEEKLLNMMMYMCMQGKDDLIHVHEVRLFFFGDDPCTRNTHTRISAVIQLFVGTSQTH